ncbi:LOW QUALITY PROTEIN: transmembrane 7 superfamily member 3-like [Macrobrachium nipponense]|uniref:LOW QUALITY PROTEIN: transmembrane 7 superfamily member 3-like n=1 Tax=Macrobrachium nipponense TaxID=159736 RepID=UPI0030C7F2B9
MKPLGVSLTSIVYLIIVCCVKGDNSTNNVSLVGERSPNGSAKTDDNDRPRPLPSRRANAKYKESKDSCNICHVGLSSIEVLEEEYPMIPNNTHKVFPVPSRTCFRIKITNIPNDAGFLIAQAHSQTRYIVLSNVSNPEPGTYTNGTNPGIYLKMEGLNTTHNEVYLANCHHKNLTVLFIVRNYSSSEPVPGAFPIAVASSPAMPQPYLVVAPNILTTEVSFRAAAYPGFNLSADDIDLHYETYLTYMYEKDLDQDSYWNTLIATSTLEGIRTKGKLVSVSKTNNTSSQLERWFVSYSGVGAVIGVIVNYNSTGGVLYSPTVSYGCNFIDAEQYRCTKLVNPLAKLFCASLLFIGGVLLFFGHRWLNFTMFTSGFLFFWFIFFLLFAQVQNASIDGLGWGTMLGAVLGGIGWLMFWHRFQRPFHSALLIIIMNVIFVGMVITYFLRYAVDPNTNMAAFVVFPVIFAVAIIAYSIADIKKVHIFSCTLLGSYAFVVPFAFYFGSSLTYIVINVIGVITVQHYSETIGYPPFQVCDIILLCLWIFLFGAGMTYQLYRDRSGPPFYPPNRASWIATKKAFNFVFDKIFSCLPMDPDPGGVGIEDHPTWKLRLSYSFRLLWKRITCLEHNPAESGYESLRHARTLTQDANDDEPEPSDSRWNIVRQRMSGWYEKMRGGRGKDEELLQAQDIPEPTADEEMLQDPPVSCCAFGKSQVVLDDAYNGHTQEDT